MKIGYLVILASLFAIQGCKQNPDPATARKNELNHILKAYLKPAVESEDYQEGYGSSQPTNRQALAGFVARYPGTEEAFQAEIWLSVDFPQREKSALAERLRIITETTSQPGTAKFAKLQRTYALYQENRNEHSVFFEQADDILNHIQEYQVDKQFLHYVKLLGDRDPGTYGASDIEPDLRLSIAYEEAYAGNIDKALEVARDLKKRFPNWEERSVDSEIELLERYKAGWRWPYSSR